MELMLDDMGLGDAYTRLASDQRAIASSYPGAMGMRRIPTTQVLMGFKRMTGQMGIWSEENMKQSRALKAIHTSIITYELSIGAIMTAQAAIRIWRSKELAKAAALTAASMHPAAIWKIPVALGAAGMVYAAFKVGMDVGVRVASSKRAVLDPSNASEVRNAAVAASADMGVGV